MANFLNSPSAWPILFLGMAVFASIMAPVPMAILQGLRDNFWFTFLQGLNGPSRLILCSVPVFIGFGVTGVMFGLFLAYLLQWGVAHRVVKNHTKSSLTDGENGTPLAWAEAIPVLIFNLSFALITQVDLIMINRFFTPEEASIFASAAVLGRAVIYVPGALVLAMFPLVSENRAKKLSTHGLLYKSLAVTIVCSGLGATLFYFWPETILNVLFGSKYVASSEILKYYGLAMVPLAILMILSYYLIARKNVSFGYIMLVTAAIEICLIYWFHSSLLSVVLIVGVVGTILLTCGLIISLLDRPSENLNPGELISNMGS